MLSVSGLSYSYSGGTSLSFPDIQCSSDQHALIIGPSGSGKTTLLHLLGGILTPTTGQILISDSPIHLLRGRALDRFRGNHIGIVFQRAHFMRSLTSIENLLLAQSLSGRTPNKATATQLMDRLSIAHQQKKMTYQLSTGEQQRLSIARALINRPSIILADEPSSALDDQNCTIVTHLLREVASENHANLIIVTHDSRIKDMFEKKIELTPAITKEGS